MFKHKDDHERFYATADFQGSLDKGVFGNYPIVTSTKDTVFVNFENGRQTFCLVDLERSSFNFRKEVFRIALTRGHDRALGHGDHGRGGHTVFDEVLDEVLADLNTGSAEFQTTTVQMKCGFFASREIPRHCLVGPKKQTEVYIPNSHAVAKGLMEIAPDGNRKTIVKEIKRTLKGKEISSTAAVLTLFYLEMDEQAIINLLSDSDFREVLTENDTRVRLPHKSHRGVMGTLGEIFKILERGKLDFRRVSSVENHREAVAFLINAFNFSPRSEDQAPVRYSKIATPLIAFKSGVELAFESASRNAPQFKDPALTDYIYEKYGNLCSTRIVTAYRKMDE